MSYLNKKNSLFNSYYNDDIFVDKSMLIKECNSVLGSEDSYLCVTRPRRFGKTLAISMLNAYYSKGADSKELFDKLAISKDASYKEHLNKHNVIWIDMASLYCSLNDKNQFVKKLKEFIYLDLKEKFSSIDLNYDLTNGTFLSHALVEINSKLNERFIFLIDEWDVLFREEEHNTKLCDEYLMFLISLFKSSHVSACIDLVYMTGILPIKRSRSQWGLNIFKEDNMLDSREFAPYVGFTEDEVKDLCEKYKRDFSLIKDWYDGYKLNGTLIYNPISVIKAIISGKRYNYWCETSSRGSLTKYINYNNGELKDIVLKMLMGEKVEIDPRWFQNDLTKIDSLDSAFSVLIHYGYLAFDEETEKCYIPNKEIKEDFVNAIEDLGWDK